MLLWEKVKSKNSSPCLFCSVCFTEAVGTPSSESGPAQLLPRELYSTPQHQAAIVLSCVCEHLSHLNLFCASISNICPKVTASLLYAISAYERFHRNTLLSGSRGKLYNEIAMKWNHLWYVISFLSVKLPEVDFRNFNKASSYALQPSTVFPKLHVTEKNRVPQKNPKSQKFGKHHTAYYCLEDS